jgi:polysaccharide biosynthesis protein PslF
VRTGLGQFTVLTRGLLGPGNGIEWGIEAMAMLRDLQPAPWYVVAGQTHPKVLLHEGDAYRDRLREQVRQAQRPQEIAARTLLTDTLAGR